MEVQEVEIFIDAKGEVKYEVRGVKGQKCLDITKDLEMDLGDEVVSREETSEMHEQDVHSVVDDEVKDYE